MKTIVASLLTAAVWAEESVSLTVYHLFEPKYTGLADKDAGDYEGELAFIFDTFAPFEKTNPEAAIGENVFEMSSVNVTGWGEYAECNAPGCTGLFNCPASSRDYCCVEGLFPRPYRANRNTLPGRELAKDSARVTTRRGYWYSFPKASEGVTWTETVKRRIKGACLAQAWRDEAGGCPDCQDLASSCVANCIKSALIVNGDDSKLKATWDKAFSSRSMCPDQPFPTSTVVV